MAPRKDKTSAPIETPPNAPPARRWMLVAPMALLLFAMVMRAGILVTGQSALRSDEAVVGLMAKHIVTRGERPLFLDGQSYGGGHAMVAYIAAPLFAIFGRSAVLLTAISMTVSLVSVVLVWVLLRRYFDPFVALAGAGLYAFSPPVVYQAFMVNGGTESFCLALVALLFFLRSYLDDRDRPRAAVVHAALAGLFAGLAYYAMDYALLYAVVFVALWAVTGRRGKWACLGAFAGAFALGCLLLIIHKLTAPPPAHALGGAGGAGVGLVAHVFGTLWHAVSGDLAAFFLGDIDNFKPGAVGLGSWFHAGVVMIASAGLLLRFRRSLGKALRRISLRGRADAPLPAGAVVALFIVVYMAIYCTAMFALSLYPTPRYFLPLCPFVSAAVAVFLMWKRPRKYMPVAAALMAVLILRGAFVATEFGARPWHEEHRIATSGAEIANLDAWLAEREITLAIAPYEIQTRLLFESDERVTVACSPISPVPRYAWYEDEFMRRAGSGEPAALIFRKDYAFARVVGGQRTPDGRFQLRGMAFDPSLLQSRGHAVGDEFVVFWPVPTNVLRRMLRRPLE